MTRRGPSEEFPDAAPGSAAEEGGTVGPLEWARYVQGAVGRHLLLSAGVLVTGLAVTAAIYATRTPLYNVEAKVLAQRQQALPSIVRPAGLDDLPTRSAPDFIRRRDAIIAMIRAANLTPAGAEVAAEPTDLLGRLRSALRFSSSEQGEDPLETLITQVDRALSVSIGEGTITIEVAWPDPQQAYLLVTAAVQNFLEARHLQEVTTIDESISLLQGRVSTMRDDLDRLIAEDSRRSGVRLPVAVEPADTTRPPVQAAPTSEQAVALRAMIEAKERAIRDVDDFRRRRLSDLQAQLDAQRAVYSEAHPNIQGLRRDIDAVSRESQQIATLREDEKRLRQEYAALAANEERRPVVAAPAPRAVVAGRLEESERVRDARAQYQRMVDRLNSARLELDAARAAFRIRYSVAWPAQVPREPFSPKARKIFGLGGAMSLALAMAAAALAEMRRGRVVERWQVEKALDLPVIGELKHHK